MTDLSVPTRELTAEDYLAIFRRRWWILLLPTLLFSAGAYLVSLKIPNRFTSTALVLVDQPQVPENYVKPVVAEDVQQRLRTMQEQILSRSNLQPIIENFGLFKTAHVPMEEQVEMMRKSIRVEAIKGEDTGRGPGLPGFYLSFTADSSQTARQVCAELLSLFIKENIKVRGERATGTTQFLAQQLDDAKKKLDEQDKKLAEFKQRFIGQLPGQEQANLTMINTLTNQLDATTQLLARAQQDKAFVETLLQQQLTAWQTTQSPNRTDDLEANITRLQAVLVDLQSRYTAEHPEVVRVKAELERLRERLQQAKVAAPTDGSTTSRANEPANIQQTRLQIHNIEATIKQKTAEQDNVQKQLRQFQARVQLSPMVEEQYKILTRDSATALQMYNDLLAKKSQSEMAKDLELRQQGEQFRVMDPPNLPEKPVFPDRPAIAGGGLGGGLLVGVLIVAVLEMRDKSMRTEREIRAYLRLPTLATVPWVDGQTSNKKRFWHRRRKEMPAAARASA